MHGFNIQECKGLGINCDLSEQSKIKLNELQKLEKVKEGEGRGGGSIKGERPGAPVCISWSYFK